MTNLEIGSIVQILAGLLTFVVFTLAWSKYDWSYMKNHPMHGIALLIVSLLVGVFAIVLFWSYSVLYGAFGNGRQPKLVRTNPLILTKD